MTSPARTPRLDRGADGHDFVRVDALVRLLAPEHGFDGVDDGRHAGLAADQDNLVDLRGTQAGVLEGSHHRARGLVDQVADQVLQLGSTERDHEVLGTGRVGRDVGQIDLRRHRRAELDLGLLGGLLEALECLLVLGQVHALVALELGQQPLDDALVEVVAAQVGVAVGGLDLEHAVAQLEDRDVECAAAQVVDRDLLVVGAIQAVGQR